MGNKVVKNLGCTFYYKYGKPHRPHELGPATFYEKVYKNFTVNRFSKGVI